VIKAFTGSDSFESYQKAISELKKLSKELNTKAKIIDADEIPDVNTFLQQIEGVDMFNPASLIFAKRMLNNKKLSEFLTENFSELQKYDIVIWQDDKLDSKLKIAKKLKDNASLFISELPKEREFMAWVKSKFQNEKIDISISQVEYLVDHLGVNKWMVINEIEKIKMFLKWKDDQNENQTKSSSSSKISDEELKKLLGFDVKGDIWTFLDAVGARNRKKALDEFEKLTFYEDNIQLILAMLDREFRIMSQVIYAKENGITISVLGINPYVLQKTSAKARNFTFKEVKNFMKKLFDLDFAIKKGNIEEKLGLTLLLSTL